VNGAVPVGPFTLSGAFGNQSYKHGEDYNTWNLGASYTFATHYTVDLRYVATDNETFVGPLGDDRVTLGLKAAF